MKLDHINSKPLRRSLFSIDGKIETSTENSDELGHISPINYDSNSNDEEDGNVENTNLFTGISTPKSKNYPPSEHSMSPLYLSPFKSMTSNIKSTPLKKGYKTPNELTSTDKVPKLSKKSLNDSFVLDDDKSESSFLNESLDKTTLKNSKVRTSLFPDLDISLPTNLFYPKSVTESDLNDIKKNRSFESKEKRQSFPRKRKYTDSFGRAGVGHNIKKPAKKKATDLLTFNSIKPITYNSENDDIDPELKGYLKELDEIKQQIKQIQNPDFPKQIIKKSLTANDNKMELPNKDEKKNTVQLNPFDNVDDDLDIENIKGIDNILDSLYDEEKEKTNTVKSTTIKNIAKRSVSELLSPTTQMCNMTSDLAIRSPKKSRLLNFSENNEKLYPLFYKENFPKVGTKRSRSSPNTHQEKKKFKSISNDQTFIDAGQKRWGLIQCEECNTAFHAGDPNDEILHDKEHRGINILNFKGWKNENVIYEAGPSRIISVSPTDSKIWVEKVKNLFQFISRTMGYFDQVEPKFDMVLLFISNSKIKGCLFTESKSVGYKILSPSTDSEEICSEEEFPIKCGVFRIWVDQKYRRRGIARGLMDCLKQKFLPGTLLRNEDIGFTSPTTDGKLFATRYFNTPYFMTYFG